MFTASGSLRFEQAASGKAGANHRRAGDQVEPAEHTTEVFSGPETGLLCYSPDVSASVGNTGPSMCCECPTASPHLQLKSYEQTGRGRLRIPPRKGGEYEDILDKIVA
jgi:hypothetical protein